MAAAGTITDTNGAYSFSGLRAGSYTVEMSNWNEASYDFGTTSASVSLATGASEIVAFEGSLVTTASISGSLFIDEFSKDSILNTGLEDNITIANVPVTLKGILVLDTMTVLTDATDSFTFPDLAEGSYRITVASMALVPGMVGFSGVNLQTTTFASGEAGTINFPFSILTQTINVSGYLGVDATNPGVTPITGWTINLYDTQLNAAAGTATGRLGTMRVTVSATSDNIQPNRTDTTVVTSAGGAYTLTGLREGPYTVTVQDSSGVWSFTDTLTKVTQNGNVAADAAIPAAGVEKAGTAVVNTDAFSGTRDVEGFGSTSTVMFAANRLDTKIEGVVVNDCDSDFNTLDPNEALGGVVVTLYDDADADGTVDTGEAIVVVDTTDATGAYAFSALIEDNYIVSAASLTSNTVLRALSATGTVTNTVAALTTAVTGAGATLNQNGTKQVGDVDPPSQSDEFPRWSYTLGTAAADGGHLGAGAGPNFLNVGAGALTTSPTNFVHLFNTGTVQGTVKAGTTGVAGVTVTITRCQTAATAPAPGACTLKHGTPSPHIANVDTDASGGYSFTTLLEGVYPVDVAPVTAGYTTITTPAVGVYRATFAENNDIETVPDFIIA